MSVPATAGHQVTMTTTATDTDRPRILTTMDMVRTTDVPAPAMVTQTAATAMYQLELVWLQSAAVTATIQRTAPDMVRTTEAATVGTQDTARMIASATDLATMADSPLAEGIRARGSRWNVNPLFSLGPW